MIVFRSFKNVFLISELRKKLLFVLGVLVVYRLGAHIPVAGVNLAMLAQYMKSTAAGGLLNYLDMFSGGMLSRCTLFALGIGPFITSSIMIQMLSMTIPSLERLAKEGEVGRRVINQYTRYLALGLSVFYSLTYAMYLEGNGLVLNPGWGFRFTFVLSLTVGSLFVMWLGEQISLFGIGNGSSMIIFAGIVSNFPNYVIKTVLFVQQGHMDTLIAILILLFYIGVTAAIVFLEKGERKIPVQYSRRVVGRRVYGGQSTFIPFKINTACVMPVIFAGSVLKAPEFLAQMFSEKFLIARVILEHLHRGSFLSNTLEFCLIIFFSFFYTALIFNPTELASNIKKSGGFIPGMRPGKKTAEFFNYILTRIGLIGAIYLAGLALLPNILLSMVHMPFWLGGTSILIAVGVALETSAQMESYLIDRKYEGFLSSGRLKGRQSR